MSIFDHFDRNAKERRTAELAKDINNDLDALDMLKLADAYEAQGYNTCAQIIRGGIRRLQAEGVIKL